MKESDLNRRAIDRVLSACHHAVYYKIADRFTRGIPDSILTWNNVTSWLEFKLLDPHESVHAQLDPDQLVELVKLQRACHRAWVIAYRRGTKSFKEMTMFYEPRALLQGAQPIARELTTHENVLRDLRTFGVATFEGHDHAALVALIHQTHVAY